MSVRRALQGFVASPIWLGKKNSFGVNSSSPTTPNSKYFSSVFLTTTTPSNSSCGDRSSSRKAFIQVGVGPQHG